MQRVNEGHVAAVQQLLPQWCAVQVTGGAHDTLMVSRGALKRKTNGV